ncbi:hypothetical protein FHS87_000941 [Roseomonas pecuniae]|uniref:Uncharacterized protein n=2 Tax=Muricoccus pecuniae TaxID=693023 RepID=A0A840YEJ4_9PROT|nr:hypothetical protein [Roseomonas pecuniae]
MPSPFSIRRAALAAAVLVGGLAGAMAVPSAEAAPLATLPGAGAALQEVQYYYGPPRHYAPPRYYAPPPPPPPGYYRRHWRRPPPPPGYYGYAPPPPRYYAPPPGVGLYFRY